MNKSQIENILESVIKQIAPSDAERERVNAIINFAKTSIEAEISKQKIAAELLVGGSIGKDTWITGTADIDFFVKFDLKYKNEKIDELLGKIIFSIFPHAKIIHGSRDYYKVNYKGYKLEFVPVLNIKEPSEAENSMDVSPFHVKYVKNKTRINNMGNQIRLLKSFAKAQGFYGAETSTAGISGYVAELLIINYGSFLSLLEAFEKAQPKIVIDIERYYPDTDYILKILSKPKIQSPLVIIDPVLKNRNAAAAVNIFTFAKMIFAIRMFLRNPSISFFENNKKSLEEIKSKSKKYGTTLVVESVKIAPETEENIFLAKLQSKLERIQLFLEKEGIQTYSFGYINKNKKIYVYFELETIKLSKYFKHYGPPVWVNTENFDEFLRQYKNVYLDNELLVVDLKRKYNNIKKYVTSVLREELKNV